MSIYENWMEKAFTNEGVAVEAVWKDYLPREQKIYEQILENKTTKISGTVEELGKQYEMSTEHMVAFVDGVNDILSEPYGINDLDENSKIKIIIDFEKLYKKMVEYKAEHLYTLPQWNLIFDEDKQKELYVEQRKSGTVVKDDKIGRNDPCPCQSGKKYKKCCGA